jgi:hypothetical protein
VRSLGARSIEHANATCAAANLKPELRWYWLIELTSYGVRQRLPPGCRAQPKGSGIRAAAMAQLARRLMAACRCSVAYRKRVINPAGRALPPLCGGLHFPQLFDMYW